MVSLERQHAGPLGILWVVFHDNRPRHACNDLVNPDVVRGQLIVPVRGDNNLAPCHQGPNTLKGLAQTRIIIPDFALSR